MHHRRPAPRHRQTITRDFFQNRALPRLIANRHARHHAAPLYKGHGFARFHANAQFLRRLGQGATACAARIQNDRHIQPCSFQGDGRAIRIIIIGKNDRAIPHRHTKILNVIAQGRGQNHPGKIIPRKRKRPLDRARRGQDLCRSDPP